MTKNMLRAIEGLSSDVDSVVLIGGSSRIPFIKNQLEEILPSEKILEWDRTDVAVALGAAYHAHKLWGTSPHPPSRTTVPDFRGDMLPRAKQTAGGALSISVTEEAHSEQPANTILLQSPMPEEKVPRGSTISVTISKGPEEKLVVVPDLVGTHVSRVEGLLMDAGLRPGDREASDSDESAKDTVLRQSPEAGGKISPNMGVSIVVGRGPASGGGEMDGEATKRSDRVFSAHKGGVFSVALGGDGRLLASCGRGRAIKLWDAGSGESVGAFPGQRATPNSVALSGDGRLLASGGADGEIKLWDTESRELFGAFTAHRGAVNSVSLSGDGQLLASGGEDHAVRLWNAETCREHFALASVHRAPVRSVFMSADGRLLASGGADNKVELWDTERGRSVISLRNKGWWIMGRFNCVAVSPDNRAVAAGDISGKLSVWRGVPANISEHGTGIPARCEMWPSPRTGITS